MVTVSIIEPPVRNGGSAASSSARPHSTPMPVGPSILWPEKTRKSAPVAVTSTGMCGTDWQASSTTSAPTSWARVVTASSGLTVPRTLDWWVSATTFVRSLSSSSRRGQVEPALVGDTEPAQRGTGADAELLPRHQVGVVLHLGDEDLVAGADAEAGSIRAGGGGVAQRVGHEVDPLGGVLGEHDLVSAGADERGDPRAGRLVGLGRLLGELVGPAVRGRVVLLVEVALGVEHLPRLLRRRAGVEVDQRLPAPHGAAEDREVGAQELGVQCDGPRATRSAAEVMPSPPPRPRSSARSRRPRAGRRARARPARRCARRRRRGRSRAGCSAGCACSG